MIVNGVDLSTYSMWIDTPQGLMASPGRDDLMVDVQAAGDILIPTGERVPSRRWSVGGQLIAPTQQDALDLWSLAKLLLEDAWLEIVMLPWSDRYTVARLQSMTHDEGRMEDSALKFTLTFVSPNPYFQALQPDTYGISAGGEVEIQVGTAAMPFEIMFIGPATKPSLTYYDAGGQVRGTIRLTSDLVTAEWIRYNSQTGEMERHSAVGIETNGAPYLDTSTREFQVSPYDGVPGKGPTMALDSGTALVIARKAFK